MVVGRFESALCGGIRRPANPFLSYDEALWVAHLSDTHTCLLNKFNVVPHHALVVTREFQRQTDPLTAADFEATLQLLRVRPPIVACVESQRQRPCCLSAVPETSLEALVFRGAPDLDRRPCQRAALPTTTVGQSPALLSHTSTFRCSLPARNSLSANSCI